MARNKNFSKPYFFFLSSIFLLVLVGQVVLHGQLTNQKTSGLEVEVSSRQRMLVQQISKLSLDIAFQKNRNKPFKEELTDLKKVRQKWVDSHRALTQGSEIYQIDGIKSLETQAIIKELNPIFLGIKKELDAIIVDSDQEFDTHLANVLVLDDQYDETVKRLGYQFSKENNIQYNRLLAWSWVFAAATSIVLLIAFFFIIRPLLRKLSFQNSELMELNSNLESVNQVKSDFLANMSHEVRTPLNGIIGTAGILSKTNLNQEQQKYLSTIRTSSENLMIIINDILDYSKLDSKKMQLEKEPFSLQKCVDEVMDLLKPSAQEKGIELISYIEESVPQHLVGDMVRLKQVLINLVNNAIKFTHQGEVYLNVNTQAEDQGFSQLKFTVKDTGIGIENIKLSGLFESFTQADNSTTRKYGGTGLGLTICRDLVQLMGGRIWAKSELGKGSEFCFTAVMESADNFNEEIQLEKLVGIRALVVDDNNTNLKILVKQLGSWGVRPTPFNNPELVQELIHDLSKFDVCIMDMQMPKMDGLQLTKIIRKHHSQKELPIVVLSSTGEHFMQDEADLFNHYLTKPVRPSKLKSTLAKMVSPKLESSQKGGHVSRLAPVSNLKILIADGDEINLAVTAKLLENMGFRAEKALDGQQVIQKINLDKFDLILMNVEMPGLTGVEATKKIKSMYFDRQAPVIFALAGHRSMQDRKKFMSNGMDDLIAKPVDESILTEKIGEWFDLETYL